MVTARSVVTVAVVSVVVLAAAVTIVAILLLLLQRELRGQRCSQYRVRVVNRPAAVVVGEDGHSVGVELLRFERQPFFAQVEVEVYDVVVVPAARQKRLPPGLDSVQRHISSVLAVVSGSLAEVPHSIGNSTSEALVIQDGMKARSTVVDEHTNKLYGQSHRLSRFRCNLFTK